MIVVGKESMNIDFQENEVKPLLYGILQMSKIYSVRYITKCATCVLHV